MTASQNVVKGPQTRHSSAVITGGGIYALPIREEGHRRSPNRTGDSDTAYAPTRCVLVRLKDGKGPQTGHRPDAPGTSVLMPSKVLNPDSDAVTQFGVTASDNSDSVPCPILGTFRLNESGQRSPKVPSHAVTVVTTLSPRNSDSVTKRSGDVCPVKAGQRSPNSRGSFFGDLCPNSNRPSVVRNGLPIMEPKETLSPCHSIPGMSATALPPVMGALKMRFGTIYQLLDVDISPGHRFFTDSDSPRNTPHSDRVTASPGDL